jgi:hypothetical protein
MRCAELKQRPEGKDARRLPLGAGCPPTMIPAREASSDDRLRPLSLPDSLSLSDPPCYYDCRVSGDPGMCLFQDASFAHRSAFYSQTRSRACLRAEFTAGHQIASL